MLAVALAACATPQPGAVTNRPEGEGYAGAGALLVRIGLVQERWNPLESAFRRPQERGSIEIRYVGLDPSGRAVFQRHDSDLAAGAPVPVAARPAAGEAGPQSGESPAGLASAAPADTREIVLDLRLTRQIRVQGKIIEVLEATPSGVVFRLF